MLQWLNVLRLSKEKKVAGVDWRVTAFFALWGVWNVYFYQALATPASSFGAAFLTLANIVWVVLAVRYSRGHTS